MDYLLYPDLKLLPFIKLGYMSENLICDGGFWNTANFGKFMYL